MTNHENKGKNYNFNLLIKNKQTKRKNEIKSNQLTVTPAFLSPLSLYE